ncbi:CAP domain-containing protein [Niallia sp.]|uniref:CAP domain-containing protein n=1 Tax=Niallia sp. TaxID=2837523 RepID=UPI00289775D6|nr:CAP domain-containing protein [Niallia sp.]
MKKKNLIFSVAAASTLLMATPLASKAEAASIQPNEAKIIYQSHNLSEDQLNKLINNISTNYQVDIDKVWKEWKDSIATQQTHQHFTKQKEEQKATPEQKDNTNTQNQSKPETTTASQNNTIGDSSKDSAAKATTSVSAYEKEVVELTNKERAKYGLPALTLDTELSKVAKVKSQDMSTNNYFDHTSPTYGSPFDMMKQFGITYKAAGENIAKGQKTPEEVVNAWMNSEGHRANILSDKFTHIGVGYVENGNYWTQQFIGK